MKVSHVMSMLRLLAPDDTVTTLIIAAHDKSNAGCFISHSIEDARKYQGEMEAEQFRRKIKQLAKLREKRAVK